jgi:phage-related protein
MKEAMMFWVNIFKGEWGKALDNVKTVWDGTFGKLWAGLKVGATLAFNGIKTIGKLIFNSMNNIFDATIGKAFDKLKSAAQGVFDTIGSAWDTVTSVMSTIYDKTLGRIFDAIGGALKGVFNFGKSIVGGVKDLGSSAINTVTGGSGTDGPSSTGGGHTFNMTFNLSGLTDRTDKRQLAREISDLVQQELSRNIGGTGRVVR